MKGVYDDLERIDRGILIVFLKNQYYVIEARNMIK